MVGKARSFSDDAKEANYEKQFGNEVYSAGAQQNSYNLGSVHFSDQSGIANISQAGTDQRKASVQGAFFRGNIGFDLQTVELDVGTATIDLNNDSSGTVLDTISTDRFVTLSAGAASDLEFITGPQRPGQRLRLYNTLSNTITIKHTAGAVVNSIRTPDGNDLTFPGDAVIDFTFDITTAQWRVVSLGGTGGGAGSTPPFVDTTPLVKGSGDASKLLRFEVDGFTAATTRVLTPQDADYTIGGLEVPQTWTGINTFAGLATSIISPTIVFGDTITDQITFVGRIDNNGIIPINNNVADLGISGKQWNTLWVQTLNASATIAVASPTFSVTSSLIVLGDSVSDQLTFIGRVDNNGIIPINNSQADLGAVTRQWNDLWIDTLRNATTVVINSPNFAMNSSQITLGDATTDNIFFLGQVANNIVIEEIAVPGNAPPNTGRFYARADGGISNPYWKDENGTETIMIDTSGTGGETWKTPVRAKADGFTFLFPNIQQIIDGVTLAQGDRVLLTDELNGKNNGIWEVSGPFAGIPLQAPLTRPDDFNSDADMVSEVFVAVEEGDLNREAIWHLVTPNPIIDNVTSQLWRAYRASPRDEISIGTLDVPNNEYVDDQFEWFGNQNGTDGLTTNINTTEPAGFTIQYTIDSNDFPSGAVGLEFKEYGGMICWQAQNTTGGALTLNSKTFFNGSEIGNMDSNNVGAGNYAWGFGYVTDVDAQSGDTMEIKLWGGAVSGDFELRAWAVYVFPDVITCFAGSCTVRPDFDNDPFIGDKPAGFAAVPLDGSVFSTFTLSVRDGFFSYLYGDGEPRIIKSEVMFQEEVSNNNMSSSVTAEWPVPAHDYIGNYNVVW